MKLRVRLPTGSYGAEDTVQACASRPTVPGFAALLQHEVAHVQEAPLTPGGSPHTFPVSPRLRTVPRVSPLGAARVPLSKECHV